MSHVLNIAARKLAPLRGLPRTTKFVLILPAIAGAAVFSADVVSRTYDLSIFKAEKDRPAPIIRGGQRIAATSSSPSNIKVGAAAALSAAAVGGFGQVPTGGGVGGKFGDVIDWPIIAIQVSLLPDGRVLSYGTDVDGSQGTVVYDIWDPKKGVGPESHTTLPNGTPTDIFCSAASLISPGYNFSTTPLTGKILSVGGDYTVNGVRNYSNSDVVVFDPANNSLSKTGNMAYARWYASMTTVPNGDKLVLGGQRQPGIGEISTELYSPTRGWRTLSGIHFHDALLSAEWYYPTAALGQNGWFYILEHGGKIVRLSNSGAVDTHVRMARGDYFYPRVMFPIRTHMPAYRMMMVRYNRRVQIADLANAQPIVREAASPKWDRKWGNLTILANGDVLASGGSGVLNELSNIAYESEIYRTASGTWITGASAQIPRLYHGNSLLLPDGSVLTAGGGAPGPLTNLNAEIYYPPYLYNADGSLARRPTIVSAPSRLKVGHLFTMTVGPNDRLSSINLVRLGSNTHSYDADARFIFAYFIQNGTTVTGYVVNDPKVVLPGYYMMFAVDQYEHPSIAKIVSIPPAVQ
jgi:hypothetical protein